MLSLPLLPRYWPEQTLWLHQVGLSLRLIVPAWSVILAAVGVGWKRKARYVLGSAVLVLAYPWVAHLLDLPALAAWTVLVIYVFATLILFVGKDPSLLWTSSLPE